MQFSYDFDVVVVGGGHAGAEAAWAGANMGARVAFVTMDPSKIGTMSCNPAIGGLAKGQMVREIDAMGGLMGLATDATGIQFRMLNSSKGPAVWGPRAQCDKYQYAREVQRLIGTRNQIVVFAGTVDEILTEGGRVVGAVVAPSPAIVTKPEPSRERLHEAKWVYLQGQVGFKCSALVLTTGTFMRGLMHTGESKTQGGRVGEAASVGISGALKGMGFELGRLKTGTPPRLAAESIKFEGLATQPGDDEPVPFSDMSPEMLQGGKFPRLEQVPCYVTHTNGEIHEKIRANLDRAPMYNGQIETSGPRYCPSIEDKVVRFADRDSHHIYLEPESLGTNEIYCNGISTSLPADVQDFIVRGLPGCENAKVLRYGYAVEYDMVWPHQIDATAMTKKVAGLFLAGQINGTSGYEEAAGQGMIAGINAVRFARGAEMVRLRRDQAYIGVLFDDLVTKTPREPYRMFTSRAEHRLLLRADNADERLTQLARELGLIDDLRWARFEARMKAIAELKGAIEKKNFSGGLRGVEWVKRPETTPGDLIKEFAGLVSAECLEPRLAWRVLTDCQYSGYIEREKRDVDRMKASEEKVIPVDLDYATVSGLRKEAMLTLQKFKPATMGQALRLAGVTPADMLVVGVVLARA
jgi:tRNA uridine 5-carboxymethylaminomethyl modification enzyme